MHFRRWHAGDQSFGNTREARLLLEAIQERQANRLVAEPNADRETLAQILPEDVPDPEKSDDSTSPGVYL